MTAELDAILDDPDMLDLRLAAKLDPVLNYKPTPTQKRCLYSPTRYRWIGGGNRSGKSAHCAVELAMAARRLHPTRTVRSVNGTYLLLAPSREQLQDPWAKKLLEDCELPGFRGKPLIPMEEIEGGKKGISWTYGAGARTIKQIKMKNGHIIRFGVSNDSAWFRRQGQALLGIALDESFADLNLLKELLVRILDANSDPKIVAEAGGGWILWGATETKANPALAHFASLCHDVNESARDFEAFQIAADENPSVDMKERERLRVVLGQDDYDIRMMGTKSAMDRLLIYGGQWDDEKHMRKGDYIPLPSDNLWVSYDPGGVGKESHDTGIMFLALTEAEPRKLHMVKYIRHFRTTLEYDIKVIASYMKGRSLEGFIYDPKCNATEKGSGQSVKNQIRTFLQKEGQLVHRGMVMPYNRHEPGIRMVQKYLEQGMVDFNSSPESGGPFARWQLIAYRSFEEGRFQGIRGVVKMNDEACDTLRYAISVLRHTAWIPRPCGAAKWRDDQKPMPVPEAPKVMSEQEKNLQAQLDRSHKMVANLKRTRVVWG